METRARHQLNQARMVTGGSMTASGPSLQYAKKATDKSSWMQGTRQEEAAVWIGRQYQKTHVLARKSGAGAAAGCAGATTTKIETRNPPVTVEDITPEQAVELPFLTKMQVNPVLQLYANTTTDSG